MDHPPEIASQDSTVLHLWPISVRQLCETISSWISRLRDRGEFPVRLFAAGLLLFAAGLKYLHLATTPLMSEDSGWQRRFGMIQIKLEVSWGIWLLAGIYSRFARLASALLFAIFAAFSAYRGMLGHGSCGCFGVVRVNPWLAFALDMFFAGSFLLIRGKLGLESTKYVFLQWRLVAVLLAWVLLSIPIIIFSSGPRLATVAVDGEIAGNEHVVLLDPKQWAGKRFPLVKHIDVGPAFVRGRWHLLFVRPGCPYCEEALRTLFSDLPQKARDKDANWALVELPPLTEIASPLNLPAPADVLLGRLSKEKIWIVNVPFTITVADGTVVEWAPGVLWQK